MNLDKNTGKVKSTSPDKGQARIACPRVLARNVDKLKISFWINWQDSSFLDEIEEIKQSIQSTESQQEGPYHCPGGFKWNVQRTGTKLFSFRLTSGDLVLLLNRRISKDKIPNASLEIGSESCWIPGFKEIVERAIRWMEILGGKFVKNQISEVHLATDFGGTHITDLQIAHRDFWITRSQLFITYLTNHRLSSISIGKGDLMLRIYDKVLELKRNAQKQALFYEVWNLPVSGTTPITRVEFQLRRPILKTIKESPKSSSGIDTFEDLCNSFQSIWEYCTRSWAKHCSQKIDHHQNHQSRASNSDFWNSVSQVIWEGNDIRYREKPLPKKDYVALRKQYLGLAMSLAAFHEVHSTDADHIISISKNIIEEDLMAFYLDDEPEFSKRIEKKKREIYESVSNLHSLKPSHPGDHVLPTPFPSMEN